MKKPQRNIQQHFVTAAYLAGFTPDGTRNSQLYVYERKTDRMFRSIPDEAAKRRNYYSIPQEDGRLNDEVEKMLTALEGQAMPVLQKVIARDYSLSTFERALLGHLIAFQEMRTPWTRAIFQKLEVSLVEQVMRVGANTPGYFERVLKKDGEAAPSVSASKLRDAVKNRRIKTEALPHAGIDTMVSLSQRIGTTYTGMLWTVLRAQDGEFLTSDSPVTRHNPSLQGMYGGGLYAHDAQVWFPLSKKACLLITHDEERMTKFNDLLDAGKVQEARSVQVELPPIRDAEVPCSAVNTINCRTVLTADRFVYSPFEANEIARLLQGESQNLGIAIWSPFSES